jgi:hypothetical protein
MRFVPCVDDFPQSFRRLSRWLLLKTHLKTSGRSVRRPQVATARPPLAEECIEKLSPVGNLSRCSSNSFLVKVGVC